jgi:hypothetical protein
MGCAGVQGPAHAHYLAARQVGRQGGNCVPANEFCPFASKCARAKALNERSRLGWSSAGKEAMVSFRAVNPAPADRAGALGRWSRRSDSDRDSDRRLVCSDCSVLRPFKWADSNDCAACDALAGRDHIKLQISIQWFCGAKISFISLLLLHLRDRLLIQTVAWVGLVFLSRRLVSQTREVCARPANSKEKGSAFETAIGRSPKHTGVVSHPSGGAVSMAGTLSRAGSSLDSIEFRLGAEF